MLCTAFYGVFFPPLRAAGRGAAGAGPQLDCTGATTTDTATFTDCDDTHCYWGPSTYHG